MPSSPATRPPSSSPSPKSAKPAASIYTPDYIVRYIVAQTVGRCIEGKKPADIEKLRFADIACGSGSFLVEVFACLIRYHLAWYLADGAEKWAKKGLLRQREIDGDYVLALAEKRRVPASLAPAVALRRSRLSHRGAGKGQAPA